jgi:predicted dehydrogenase
VELLWHDAWSQTPGYEVPDCAVLISVTAAVPLVRLENASGRVTRRPYRKAATFLVTDGPVRTLRKARTKREEPRYTGDFRVGLILGTSVPSGDLVVGLGSRVPPAAQQLVVHRDLVKAVPAGFGPEDLERAAAALAGSAAALARLGRQGFLYSAMAPPAELAALLGLALDEAARPAAVQREAGQQQTPAQGTPAQGTPAQGTPAQGTPARETAGRETAGPAGTAPAAIRPPAGGGREPAGTVMRLDTAARTGALPVAVLGAGDYTRTEIIPALRKAGFRLYSVANREPQIAAMVGRQYGFAVAATDSRRAIEELPGPGLVVVATAHDSHADLASQALAAGHRVFIEKPPAVTAQDVHRLAAAMREHPGYAEIGFNRRYHPLVRRARARLAGEAGPVSISCTVKELAFEPDHWYFWPNQGTRITGNLCHWIDLAVFLIGDGALPVSLTLSPAVPGTDPASDEERVLTVTFDDGSLLTILATIRGDDIRGVQEQMEIRRGRVTITIDDLWKLRTRSEGVDRRSRTLFRDKAHATMYREALGRVAAGQPAVYPVRDMVVVSAIQIAASDLAREGRLAAGPPGWMSLAGAPPAPAPGNTAPGNTVPGMAVPGNTVPENTVPGNTVPGNTVPGMTVPG